MCVAPTHRPPRPCAARRAPHRIPSGCRRSTAARLRTIRRSLCLWALYSFQDPPDGTPAGTGGCVVSTTPEGTFDMSDVHDSSVILRFHYSADSTTFTSVRRRFSSTETRTGSATSRPNPLSTQEPSARSRAYARVARELEQWVVSTDTQAKSRWDPPPPKHKISLRRARDEPPRARARVVAHGLGQLVGVCTSSFCTCDGFFSSDGKGRADARARYSEIVSYAPVSWRFRTSPRARAQRAIRRGRNSHADLPLLCLGENVGAGPRSWHLRGADRRRLMRTSRP